LETTLTSWNTAFVISSNRFRILSCLELVNDKPRTSKWLHTLLVACLHTGTSCCYLRMACMIPIHRISAFDLDMACKPA
jgi:hypothetical protein